MNGAQDQVANQGLFVTMKTKLEQWFAQLNFSLDRLGYAALSFAVGFATAFFLKKFGKGLFMLLFCGVVILLLFNYLGLITVHWTAIQSRIGLPESMNYTALFQQLLLWIRTHLLYSISGVIGFLIGYRSA